MNTGDSRSASEWLFNPFARVAGGKALGWGAAAIAAAAVTGFFGHTHFDGVLDNHTGAPAPLWLFLAEGVVDWLCLAGILLAAGRIISRTAFRTIDVLGTQALARWPAFAMTLIALPPVFRRFGNDLAAQALRGGPIRFQGTDAAMFIILLVLMIPFYFWMIVLMYKAFSVACNVKGVKAIATFIAALVVAEILSKLIITALFRAL